MKLIELQKKQAPSRMKVLVCLGLGLLLGVAASTVLVWVNYVAPARRDVADLYVIGVERNIAVNELILDGKTNEAMRMLENDLLVTAAGIQDAFSEQPGADYFLWHIWNYFDSNELTPTGKFSGNLTGINTNFPTYSGPAIYYFESYQSYLEYVMPVRRQGE